MFESTILRCTSLCLLFVLAACSALGADEDHSGGGDWNAPGDLADNDGGRCVVEPGVDSDGDGLLDIYEDLNQNCIVDEGETDPFDPDTDGDGLLDGDEDADGNGVWDKDRGELNPLSKDTDGNGIPDAEEPKAQVCDRKHANRVLAERRMLPEGRVLYLHPEIHDAAPYGDTQAVFVLGSDQQSAGIIYDSPLDASAFEDVVNTLGEGLFAPEQDSEIYLKDAYLNEERGTVEVHMRLDAHEISLEELHTLLGAYIPELQQPMPLAEKYAPTKESWDIQLLGEQVEQGTRWALSWKPAGESADWFRVLRPKILGDAAKPTVRFVCENVEVRSRQNLHVYLLFDEEMHQEVTPWLDILQEMHETRMQRDASTAFYALDEAQNWVPVDDAVQEQHVDGLVTAFPSDGVRSMVTEGIQQIPAMNNGEGEEHLVLLLSGEGQDDIEDTAADLPPFPQDLANVRVVIASPTSQPFACTWRMSAARRTAIEQLVDWSNARHIGQCESAGDTIDPAVVFELAGTRWEDTERRAIPGTLWIADRATSVPAISQYVAGQRVIRAPRATDSQNTAVSFAAWFGDSR